MLSAIAAVLRKWLVTQLIAMVTIGAVTTIVLLVARVKAAFALGLLAGLFEFIPTVGPILSALPGDRDGLPRFAGEGAVGRRSRSVGIQFLENHLLIPLLMKGGMDLPPALTILSQALMALLFGFLGLMCAVPLLAATMVAVKMLYVEDVVGERADSVPTRTPRADVDVATTRRRRFRSSRAFPRSRAIPRVALGRFPTPVVAAPAIAPTLWIKRDDLCADPVGGNKVRALEFLLGGVEAGDRRHGRLGRVDARARRRDLRQAARRDASLVGRWQQEMNATARVVAAQTARTLAEAAPVFRTPVERICVGAGTQRLRGADGSPPAEARRSAFSDT